MPYEIDLLDKKIIAALNENVRANYSEIAKKLRASNEVINYRIKRLEKEKIIREYVTIFGFGYWAHKILVTFSKIDAANEKRIIEYLKTHPNINWITPCTGSYDLIFAIMAKNPEHFDSILNEVLGYIGPYLRDYKFAISTGSQTFGHTYILGTIKEPGNISRNTQLDNFDEKDKRIALILHKNARAKLMQIYKETKIPIDTIKYRIKNMEKNSIIKRYRLILDTTKLGYNRYELFLKCSNLSDRTIAKFKEYAKRNTNIEFFSKCVGGWDIEFTAYFKDVEELRLFILDVKKEFGDYIQKFESVTLFETYNYVYFPKELR